MERFKRSGIIYYNIIVIKRFVIAPKVILVLRNAEAYSQLVYSTSVYINGKYKCL